MVEFDFKGGKGKIQTDPNTLDLIRNHFSVKNDSAGHARRMAKKAGRPIPKVADRQYAITPTGLFDFGLYMEIRKFLISTQILDINFTEDFLNHLKCGVVVDSIDDTLEYPLRYFQEETVRKALKIGRGTIIIGTGGGKSLTTASLITNIWNNRHKKKFKCLVIVPGVSLVEQLTENFDEYKVKYTYSGWSGKTELQDTEVIICNTENLCAKFKSNSEWIKNVDLVIVDECHKVGRGTKQSEILEKIKTPNKYGFTGTLSKELLDKWKVIGIFGPLLIEKKSKELRDEKFLTEASVNMIKLVHPSMRLNYKEELDYLYGDEKRNNIICKLANKIKNNTLILVNHHDHMNSLVDSMNLVDKRLFTIKGETPVEERSKIIDIMENSDDVIVVAMASVFSTGINIKNLHNIFIVAGGKSFIRLVQGIGRGLRLHENKIKLTIVDIYDNLRYSNSHAEYRKEIYDDEEIPWAEKEIIL